MTCAGRRLAYLSCRVSIVLAGVGCAVMMMLVDRGAMAASARPIAACGEQNADVILSSKDMEIAPDGAASVVLSITCDGAPLLGVTALVSVEPQAGSGGHLHYDDRPPGSLDGKELADAASSVAVKTGVDGRAVIRFDPPGKSRKTRNMGIAGVYEIRAHLTGAPEQVATLPIIVRVPGLVQLELQTDGPLSVSRAGTESHPDGTHGTPKTNEALWRLAEAMAETQRLHNQTLEACGKEPWVIWPLGVNDVSLPWGGLFDHKGDWAPPHQTHGRGLAADLNHFFAEGRQLDCSGRQVSLEAWLMAVLLEHGRALGTWDAHDLAQPSRFLHLNIKD